jgi:hypothetical protein
LGFGAVVIVNGFPATLIPVAIVAATTGDQSGTKRYKNNHQTMVLPSHKPRLQR